ncbi:MAG: thioredoxin domain-containing protein [Pseudomonadota bacterium]
MNRLADESSPYLRQHADNPVHWQPWDDAALNEAKASGKPVLLSIGYSSCHWCHVMAHESFEDPDVAQVMNEHFINIKVDREERPDLDKVYQTALQLINPQGGGWPLTMFLDPQTLLPFFGGTYFPKTPRYQLPGFTDLLLRLHEVFETKDEELKEQSEKLSQTLAQMNPPEVEAVLTDEVVLQNARDQLGQQYDKQEGGFGNTPKFPMPNTLERVLRHWAYAKRAGAMDRDGLDMVMITLTQMARGGIYDHLGGGFCRYATDRKWMIPHFEKMLYDNGQLLSLYSHALKFGHDELFQHAITDTVAWLVREMRHPDGGFYAALDADSEGEEGKFYVWRREQVKRLLSEEEYLIVETLYGLDKPANFENKWNLHRYDSWRSVVQRLSLERPEADEVLDRARAKLFAARETRVRPETDTKILTAWNALLIRGLAHAGDQLARPDWLALAQQAVDFIRTNLWDGTTLYATFSFSEDAGQPRHPGYLDDYANLLDALLTLLEYAWREEDMAFALKLADSLQTQFYDEEDGGFYFTPHHHEALIHRPKPTMDDALPPGNGTAASAFARLAHLTGKVEYLETSDRTLRWARGLMERVPAGHCGLLHALEESLYPGELVILRGPEEAMQQWRKEISNGYTPWRHVYTIGYADTKTLPEYLPRLVSMEQQSQVTAYVCTGLTCSLPMTSLDKLKSELIG